MSKINPYLQQWHNYAKACELAGYRHYDPNSESAKFDFLPSFEELRDKDIVFDEIRNPVVHRAVCQVRKVVNAIIRQYGRPDQINIEFTRHAKNSFKKGKKFEKGRKNIKKKKSKPRNNVKLWA